MGNSKTKTPAQTVKATVSEPTTDVAVATATTDNNVVEISAEGKKLLETARIISKGVSINVSRHTALFYNKLKDAEGVKKNNKFSIAFLNDKEKADFKKHVFEQYIDYKNKGFEDLPFVKALKHTGTFNIKVIVEKFEAFLEKALFEAGIIAKDNTILKHDEYREWYNKCRLYLFDKEFAEQAPLGNLVLYNFKLTNVKDMTLDGYKRENPVTVFADKHVRMTTAKIQSLYEEACKVKFEENIFAYTV